MGGGAGGEADFVGDGAEQGVGVFLVFGVAGDAGEADEVRELHGVAGRQRAVAGFARTEEQVGVDAVM